jgi:hypothetical protein
MRNQGKSPRRSAKQVISDLAIIWMKNHDKSDSEYKRANLRMQIFTLEIIALHMEWSQIATKLEKWREHGEAVSEDAIIEAELFGGDEE